MLLFVVIVVVAVIGPRAAAAHRDVESRSAERHWRLKVRFDMLTASRGCNSQ